MKTFTAKQFSRAPAQVFDAARDDGTVEITHDRFKGKFILKHEIGLLSSMLDRLDYFDGLAMANARSCMVDNGDGTFNIKRTDPLKEKSPEVDMIEWPKEEKYQTGDEK